MISFGVDVGGSGAKGAPVDLDTGKLLSKRFEEFDDVFDTRADVVPARLRNNVGIVGAAMTAATEERE